MSIKERADEILLYQAMDVEGAFEVGDFQSIEQYHSESQDLIRDQQSRIDELEAKTRWKPIADMPEELKDGREIWIKGEDRQPMPVRWDEDANKFTFFWIDTVYLFKSEQITHYMEIPND